jgi:hypothetical protein
MKSFSQFIKEAVETVASTEAKNRGLVGNGHGDWYDAQGNFVAKTIKGKLKFFGQGDTVSKDGVPGEEIKLKSKQKSSPQIQPQQVEPEQQQVSGITVVLGRFNPPSKNHIALLKSGFDTAKRKGHEFRIYPSRIEDGQANPLNPRTKIDFMRAMYVDYADYIVDSEESRTIFDVLSSLYQDGYKDVSIVVGQDRLGEFQNLIHKAQGEQYQFDNIEVIPSGVKDPDSDIESPGSSSMMRASAAMGDFQGFSQGLPPNMDIRDKESLFNIVIDSLQVSEDTKIWRIVPEMDFDGLRWSYKHEGIYEIGSLVESMSSGLVGRVIRRGANYLISVSEDGIMFKSWLKDVQEVYEVGTDEYRQHAQELTPGQSVVSYTGIMIQPTINKKTINTNRKKVSKVK